jgi:hypothetical protein
MATASRPSVSWFRLVEPGEFQPGSQRQWNAQKIGHALAIQMRSRVELFQYRLSFDWYQGWGSSGRNCGYVVRATKAGTRRRSCAPPFTRNQLSSCAVGDAFQN